MGEVVHKAPILFDVTSIWARSNILTIRKNFDEERRELTYKMSAVNIL